MKLTKLITCIFIIAAFVHLEANAQIDTSTARDKYRKVVKEKLIEKVGIDAPTADKVMEMTAANRRELQDIKKQIKDAKKYIYDNTESSDIGTKLDELYNLEDKLHKTKMDFHAKMKSMLTPSQVAKTMTFRKDLSKFMKDEVDKKKKDRKEKKDRKDKKRTGEGRNDFDDSVPYDD